MTKVLLTLFLIVLLPYVIVTISRGLKKGRQATVRFYIFLFIIMLLALSLFRIL